MPLVGTLSTMPLPDLLQWLAQARKSGWLRIERNKVAKRIAFRNGRVVSCASDEPRQFLGHFLVSRGKISEETLREALARQELSGRHLGTTLVEMGALQAEELQRLLQAQAEEILFSLFEWEEAVFRFQDDEVPEGEIAFPVDLPVEDVLLRGLQRLDEMRRIRQIFPDDRVVLERTTKQPPRKLLERAMARRLYEAVDGRKELAEILLHARTSEYLALKFLFELRQAGYIRLKDEGERAPASTPGSTPKRPAQARADAARANGRQLERDLEVARRMLEQGDHEAALELLNRAYQAYPSDERVRALLAEAEAAFLEAVYRDRLPPDSVPALTRPLEELTAEHFSPEEFFLLSRINGTWDLKSIIQISPIREVEALRALLRMLDRGLVTLR